MDWTWYLFRFDGRINRASFWLAMPVLLSLMITLGGIVAIHGLSGIAELSISAPRSLQAPRSRRLSVPDMDRPPPTPDQTVRHSLLIWVYFAISIKRLHDRDKSGWWMVPFFAVPGLYNSSSTGFRDSPADLPLAIAAFGSA